MKRKRSLLAILLSVVMVIGLLPANPITAYAAEPEFYAVFNTAAEGTEGTAGYKPANTLSFYYDTNKGSRTGTVYDDLPTQAEEASAWKYHDKRASIKNVVIDVSAADYSGLKSTAFMFADMFIADDISGCENLDVSNVTDMQRMFCQYGGSILNKDPGSTTITAVPNVSGWDTGNVTNMSEMFMNYAPKSTVLTVVPDVAEWDTGNVTNMSGMFYNYARASTGITAVPDVSKWNTGNVTDMNSLFSGYAYGSTGITAVPDVSKWNTGNVTDMSSLFLSYAYGSTAITAVPDVSGWDTSNVTYLRSVFGSYAKGSTAITAVPDVSEWDTSKVTEMKSVFSGYGGANQGFAAVPEVSNWDTGNVTTMETMFSGYAKASTAITAVPDVSKWDTGKVEKMASMFVTYAASSTSKLQPLDLSGWSIASLTDASSMFKGYAQSNNSGDPIVYATNWATNKATGVTAGIMFKGAALRNAPAADSAGDQWSYANTGETGCFTIKPVLEFYAVFNTAAEGTEGTAGYKPANTLSFYYDTNKGSRAGTVYADLPTEAAKATDWGYHDKRASIKNVVIDASAADYSGLKSTAFMFADMFIADDISGCENLDVSNVTDMQSMFYQYGGTSRVKEPGSTTITAVPNVSGWDTGNVTNMSNMFKYYAPKSTVLTAVPDVAEWDTGNVTNMSGIFNNYARASTVLTAVPDVAEWDTGNVTNMSGMFYNYAKASTAITAVPDVSDWNTGNVKNMYGLFFSYANVSTVITAVPDVSNWNTGNATTIKSVFGSYAEASTAITAVPDVSKWDTSKVTEMDSVFAGYGYSSQGLAAVPDVSNWDTGNVTSMKTMFCGYAMASTAITAVPDVSKWDTGKVEKTGSMFADYAASSTSKLQPLDLSGWSIASLTDAGGMFRGYAQSNNSGDPIVYATNWATKKATGVTADIMFNGAALRNAPSSDSDGDQWSYANTGETGCFTKAPVSYIDSDGSEKTVDDYTVVNGSDFTWGDDGNDGWYVVNDEVTMTSEGIKVTGAVRLILTNGSKLTVQGAVEEAGIRVSGDGNSLTIYAQSADKNIAGSLYATGNAGGAGIGGGSSESGSNITINGGNIYATGGDGGAGIGGGSGQGGSDITINGGKVFATGGLDADGIGGAGTLGYNIIITTSALIKADTTNPPETVIANDGTDLCDLLAGKRYVTAIFIEYDVTFDLQGKGSNWTVKVASGSCAERPEEDPEKEGWEFIDWFEDALGVTLWNFEENEITEPTTIYAVWEKIKEEEPEIEPEPKPVHTGAPDNPVTGGFWNVGPGGAWTYRTNGLFRNTWGYIRLEDGRTGWFWFDKYGIMQAGWRRINGKWYYFNEVHDGTYGMMLANTITPDGYRVGEDGAWIEQ